MRVVIDSGLMRRARFDPVTGMSRLETQRISRASAEQRRGRAGRTAAGVCYRAWSAGAHAALAAFTPAEILEADLAPLALELANWGARDAAELRWLDAPPAAMLASARDLLRAPRRARVAGRISAHGRDHGAPAACIRAWRTCCCAPARSALLPLAAELAALLSERDLLRGGAVRATRTFARGSTSCAVTDAAASGRPRRLAARTPQRARSRAAAAARRGRSAAARRATRARRSAVESDCCSLSPTRIASACAARAREGRYTLANGRGALFAEPQALARQELIVAVDLDDRDRDARILLAAPLERAGAAAAFRRRS